MTERIYNVAVIGYGLSAKVFMIPFLDGVQLKLRAIVQRNPTIDNDATRDHPNVKTYRSNDEMLKEDNVDIVIVATPPPTHFSLCKQALEAGKHGITGAKFIKIKADASILAQLFARSPSL